MPEGWVWDESLFAGSSAFYDRGRIPYPPGLRDAFAAEADLHGSPRLMDVSCGGAFVHVAGQEIVTPSPEQPFPHPLPPADDIRRLKQSYLGPERRAGQVAPARVS